MTAALLPSPSLTPLCPSSLMPSDECPDCTTTDADRDRRLRILALFEVPAVHRAEWPGRCVHCERRYWPGEPIFGTVGEGFIASCCLLGGAR